MPPKVVAIARVVSFPDPTLKREKGLGTRGQLLGLASSGCSHRHSCAKTNLESDWCIFAVSESCDCAKLQSDWFTWKQDCWRCTTNNTLASPRPFSLREVGSGNETIARTALIEAARTHTSIPAAMTIKTLIGKGVRKGVHPSREGSREPRINGPRGVQSSNDYWTWGPVGEGSNHSSTLVAHSVWHPWSWRWSLTHCGEQERWFRSSQEAVQSSIEPK